MKNKFMPVMQRKMNFCKFPALYAWITVIKERVKNQNLAALR